MKKSILWIEDESDGPLVERKNRLEAKGFDLTIAYNATMAETLIEQEIFDIYLVDIRLRPGDADKWQKHWGERNQRLGIQLLEIIMNKFNGYYSKVIIYTIEGWDDLFPIFEKMHIKVNRENYLNKNDNYNLRSLVEIIKKL